jgi:hypothetical protein
MTTNQNNNAEGFVEFQSDAFANVQGFWNLPKDGDDSAYKGKSLRGILLSTVRTIGGKPAEFPFYVFELTAGNEQITVQDPATKVKSEKALPAGTRVGVSASWVALKGLDRKIGHEVIMTYLGRKTLPNKRQSKDIKVQVSTALKREIEQLADTAADADGVNEVPFG